jgi:surface antigen
MMRLAVYALSAISFCAEAQPQSIPGLIAKRETELLSHGDKIAAYDAEQAVLSSDWGTRGYNWKGPDGSYGTIIAGGVIPQAEKKQVCRRFIHIVHHANDGGANPTFQGMVCRAFPEGQWMLQ